MAQPLINVGAAVGDGTGELGPRAWLQKINRLPISDSTINAGSGDYTGTKEQKITAAIAAAVATGAKYVWVPQSMLPYSADLVTFSTSVLMLREGGVGDVGAFDVKAYGAIGDGVTNDYAEIAAAIAGAGTSELDGITGTVFFPAGTFGTLSQIQVPNKVRLVGGGRSSSVIKALTGFPINTAVVRLGRGVGTFVFGCRVENLAINCNSIAGSVGIYSTEANEGSGMYYGVIYGFTAYGIQFDGNLVEHTSIELAEIYGAANALAGIYYNGVTTGHSVRRVTINGTAGSPMTDGIFANGAVSLIDIYGFHGESLTNGIHFAAAANGVVSAAEVQTTVVTTVRIDATAGAGTVCLNIGQALTNTIVDSLAGITITTTAVPYYCFPGTANQVAFSSVASPAALAATVNDYALPSTETVRLTPASGGTTITGMTGGANGRRVRLINVGTNPLVLANNNAGSAAANRFNFFNGDVLIPTNGLVDMQYGTQNNQWYGQQIATPVVTTPTEAVLVSGAPMFGTQTVVVVTLTAARVVGAPLFPVKGNRVVYTLIQDGTGGRAITWNAVFKTAWVDTGNTLNKRSSIAYIYDGTNWNQDGAQTPYV